MNEIRYSVQYNDQRKMRNIHSEITIKFYYNEGKITINTRLSSKLLDIKF